MGSDLDRRGLQTTLPLWSAVGLLERPDLVRQIHLENLLAGADVITTDSFRTTARTLRYAGIDPVRAAELDALAVQLAIDARTEAGRPEALIAGSMAPLEDCYLPTFETPSEVALAEHRAQAGNLAAAGVDLIMVETMPTEAEAENCPTGGYRDGPAGDCRVRLRHARSRRARATPQRGNAARCGGTGESAGSRGDLC
jgi:homocysteine S-methyltransferase